MEMRERRFNSFLFFLWADGMKLKYRADNIRPYIVAVGADTIRPLLRTEYISIITFFKHI